MVSNETILKLIAQQEQYIIDCRRHIHGLAELSGQEFKTKAFILEQVNALGLPYEEVPTTGLIVKLDTGRPGKMVALRADIDALPVTESPTNLAAERVCHSQTQGTCHACGHDGHTSMLLGAMRVLTQLKDELTGTILFCFEEGEETNCGIKAMMAALEKYPVDTCWGIHIYAGLEQGKISVDAGPRMAGCVWLKVRFKGKGGHGPRPDMAHNPLFCGVTFLDNLGVAYGQQLTAGETVTKGITTFHCGEASNVIAETAEIGGTLRFFNTAEGLKAYDIFKNVARNAAAIHGCEVEFPAEASPLPALVNDKGYAALAAQAIGDILPGAVAPCEPWYASETFAHYSDKYPGVFAFLGLKNEAAGFGAPHHNEKFDFSEDILKTGATATVRYVVELLGK